MAFLNNMTTGLFGRTFAKKLIEMPGPIPNPTQPGQAATLNLQGSVGAGGDNNSSDVEGVKNRLVDLGFSWIGRNSTIDNETIRTIKLFQAIIRDFQIKNYSVTCCGAGILPALCLGRASCLPYAWGGHLAHPTHIG